MRSSNNITKSFIKFFILVSILGTIISILTSEIFFHTILANDFVNSIQISLKKYNVYVSDEKITDFCNILLHYTYISMAISSIICLALFFILSIVLSQKLIKPLKKLSQMVDNLTHNVYSEINEKFPNEIDILKDQFNQLSHKLCEQEEIKCNIVLNVSHELKTPLTTIQGILEGSLDGIIELDKNNIRVMQNEITRLKYLLNDMEDSIYNYNNTLNITEIEVTKLISDITVILGRKCSLKGIHLSATYDDSSVIFADEARLLQVMNNIIDNSIKYTPEGGSIFIKFYSSREYQCISFKDTGIGIPEHDIPLIFERFYRGEKSRSRKTGGAGIGLSIVKNIVDAHNGLIGVKSKLGEGTEIVVKLPFKKC